MRSSDIKSKCLWLLPNDAEAQTDPRCLSICRYKACWLMLVSCIHDKEKVGCWNEERIARKRDRAALVAGRWGLSCIIQQALRRDTVKTQISLNVQVTLVSRTPAFFWSDPSAILFSTSYGTFSLQDAQRQILDTAFCWYYHVDIWWVLIRRAACFLIRHVCRLISSNAIKNT